MSSNQAQFMKSIGITKPLIVAPMAGGPTTVELVVASSNAGALGSIGGAYFTPEALIDFTSKVRAKTTKPIAINLFIPHPQPVVKAPQIEHATRAMKPFRDEFHLNTPQLEPPYEEDFDKQFEAALKLKPEVLSFVFGILPKDYTAVAKKMGIQLIGTATSLEEALQLIESGVDAITLQGFEAGGHRGLFEPTQDDPEIPMLELLRQCKEKISIPLIAAGGIMSSSDIKHALAAGAAAVQMGTAFLATKEAGTNAPYRRALLESSHRKTKTTRAFSGRFARGIENRFMLEIEKDPSSILPFPAQNKFTRDIRNACAKENSPDCLSLWSGTGEGTLWTESVQSLIEHLF